MKFGSFVFALLTNKKPQVCLCRTLLGVLCSIAFQLEYSMSFAQTRPKYTNVFLIYYIYRKKIMDNLNLKSAAERLSAPTPPFFKKLARLGVMLTGISVAIMKLPFALPAAVVTAAGYCAVGGSVTAFVAKFAVDNSAMENK